MKNKKLRNLILSAVLASLSIVFGKLLAINIGDTIRISFENLPLLIASVILGPIYGGASGLIADVLGCFIKGYTINPGITFASILMGVIPGVFVNYVFKTRKEVLVMLSCFISHVISSMLVKTVALHIYYKTPYSFLFATRIPIYVVIGVLEGYLCASLANRKNFRQETTLR